MKQTDLVFVPGVGIGHLVSIVEFAKQLLDRDARLAITILMHRKVGEGSTRNMFCLSSRPLAGLVIDFRTCLIDVANELNVPSYIFFLQLQPFLFMLYLPTHYEKFRKSFDIMDPDSDIPTYGRRVPSRVLPTAVLDKEIGF
ncbi:hypothetical protein Leryth_015891 [Lithospermum erythrorhizon]|nr:hypothetical protein Leryth_015891 [Lithospermum erythrorhizon]